MARLLNQRREPHFRERIETVIARSAVGTDPDEGEPDLEEAWHERRVVDEDPGGLAVCAAGRGHGVERGEVRRIPELAGHAEGVGQVGWTHEEDVDAVDGRNGVRLAKGAE